MFLLSEIQVLITQEDNLMLREERLKLARNLIGDRVGKIKTRYFGAD